MDNGIDPDMGSLKEFIDALKKEHGTWRNLGDALGINFQDLQRWSENGGNLQGFINKLEKIRVKRKMSRSAFWNELVRVPRK